MRDSGLLLQVVHNGMKKAGVDVDTLYQQLGFDPEHLDFKLIRSQHERQALFWEALEKLTGDREIGLSLCPHLPPFHGEVLEYLIYSSASFGEGFGRTVKYLRLVSDALSVRLVEDGAGTRLEVGDAGPKLAAMRHTEICLLYGLILFIRKVTDGQFKPISVALTCEPRAPATQFEHVFACPVQFAATTASVRFDPTVLSTRSPGHDVDLLRLHEEFAQKKLIKLERQDLIERIRRLFAERLELEQCDLEGIAAELKITPRRLRFELAQADTSFSDLLANFRFDLAKKLLARTKEPIENIVYLTGFSEPSTFYRAFKRWAGVTPVQYREGKQSPSD